MSEESKAETNAKIGRMYYQAQNDSAGYPNGMAYWPEMSAIQKYTETATALDLIEQMTAAGMITINVPMGFGEKPEWGKGDCKELFDLFQTTQQKELDEFKEKLRELQQRMKSINAG